MKDKKEKKKNEVECELCEKFRKGINEATDIDSIFGTDEEKDHETSETVEDHGDE